MFSFFWELIYLQSKQKPFFELKQYLNKTNSLDLFIKKILEKKNYYNNKANNWPYGA